MDKIDMLLEEFSLMQKIKEFKDRILKQKKPKRTTTNKSKEYTGPRKKEVDAFNINKDRGVFINIANDQCSRKMASNKEVIKAATFTDPDATYFSNKPGDKEVVEAIDTKVDNQANFTGGFIHHFDIDCKDSKYFIEDISGTINDFVKSKDNKKIIKDFGNRFACFNSDGFGNYYLFDNKTKTVYFYDHERLGKGDEFSNYTSNKDLSFKKIIKLVDPNAEVRTP